MYDEPNVKGLILSIAGIVFGILLVISLIFGIYRVPAGHVGVITRFGAINRVANPGVGLKIPLVESRKLMSAQTQKIVMETEAASENLQAVQAMVSVNYRLIGERAADLYQEVGVKYEEIAIAPQIEQAFKSVTALYSAEEIITQRTQLSIEAKEKLQEAVEPFYIIVQTFNIENIQFSDKYNDSIERKQQQEQEVEIAKLNKLEAEINAETIKIQAQAEADAQEILNKTGALSRSYLQYLFLTNWNGILPEVISGTEPVFDISDYLEE